MSEILRKNHNAENKSVLAATFKTILQLFMGAIRLALPELSTTKQPKKH